MRHLKDGRKLNRTAAHRKALMRNLVKALLQREQIRTTDAKAKELRRWADRIVTLGKKGSLHARRLAFAYLGSRKLVKHLFDDVAPRFHERAGGYTRVLKIGPRRGDAASLSLVELTVRKGGKGGKEAAGDR
jgi:large subunit ribosomal protein L17